MSLEEHTRHHQAERGFVMCESVCAICGVIFKHIQNRIDRSVSGKLFCGKDCVVDFQRKFKLDKTTLEKLVWEMPITKIAIMYDVSDVAIHKRCKKLGVIKPPRGYNFKGVL